LRRTPLLSSAPAFSLTRRVPSFLVYALDRLGAACEWCCDAVAAVPAAPLTGLPLARLSPCVTCLSVFRFCRVLTRCVPLCLVYALGRLGAASESCCDAVAAVLVAPLTGMPLARLCACVTCLSLFRFCYVLTWLCLFCLVYALDGLGVARESCCDAVAVVPAALLTGLPLARLSACLTCPSLFRSCYVLT
jgi:hypothetical protein